MKLRSILSIVFLVLGICCSNSQNDTEIIFQGANESLENQDYSAAILAYESILDSDLLSPELFLNLGNAHFNNGDLAKAIFQCERGIKYYPGNKLLQSNLQILSSEVETEILEVQDFVLLRFWKGFSSSISTAAWAIIQIILSIAIIIACYNWLLNSSQKNRRSGFLVLLFSTLLLLVSLAAGQASYKAKFSDDFAIVNKSASLKEGPDARSGDLLPLSEGVKVEIKDKIGEWYHVGLLNKQLGWISGEDLYII